MEGRDGAPAKPPNPAMPYREDCWSEGETSMLVDTWGDRYLELNRGNLRQKQWQEVADAVNARPGSGRRPPRTDVQCKNRIDTLKKKYKIEKSKISDGGFVSQWAFYSRLDMLIGSSVSAKKLPSSPPLALPLPSHRKGLPLPPPAAAIRTVDPLLKEKRQRASATAISVDDSFLRRNLSAAAAAAAAAANGDYRSSSRSSRSSMERSGSSREKFGRGWRKGGEGRDGDGNGDGMRELARAIERFAEIYEKVEVDKQRQMMELEKQRMEFIKGLEFQRMQMFVDTQVQMEKIKRIRRSDADSYS